MIPKSVNPARIAQNLQSTHVALSDDDMQAIARLDKKFRYVTGEFWTLEGNSYTLEELWA
ncbi:hypothetical protein [Fulvivirga imtechensis]|uniref:hypothetical protein n=1 Tax=Fulvivirga imtechensis TaxID=881893 RepID=UPI00316ADB5F